MKQELNRAHEGKLPRLAPHDLLSLLSYTDHWPQGAGPSHINQAKALQSCVKAVRWRHFPLLDDSSLCWVDKNKPEHHPKHERHGTGTQRGKMERP